MKGWSVLRALMTSPNAESDLLMAFASRSVSALTPDFPVRSLPAKSNKLICEANHKTCLNFRRFPHNSLFKIRSSYFATKERSVALWPRFNDEPNDEMRSRASIIHSRRCCVSWRNSLTECPFQGRTWLCQQNPSTWENTRIKIRTELSLKLMGATWDPNCSGPISPDFQFVRIWWVRGIRAWMRIEQID